MRPLFTALAENRLNLLVLAVPVSWFLHEWLPGSAWLFTATALSLVPLAGLIGLALIATRIRSRKDHVPFGPFLAAGTLTAMFVGYAILDWYRV